MNVFPNFILIKLATFNDKDPFWMLEYLKEKLNGATNVDYITLKNIIAEVSELVWRLKMIITNSLLGN